jgi:hypothetical protein
MAYIESTIPSYLTARPSRDMVIATHQQLTSDWWSTANEKYSLYISATVLDEISVGDVEAVSRRIAVLRDTQVLPIDPAIAGLADEYNQLLGLPPKAYNDGVHLAYGTVFEMDYVVTWNMRHMANSKTMRVLTEFNVSRGLHVPLIVTPEYLLGLVEEGAEP